MSENLYTLPQGWAWKKLGDIVDFQGGSQPPKNDFIDECLEGYVRLIQIRDYKTDNHIVYVKKDAVRKFCNENDIMIGRYGPPVFQILRGIKGAYNVALMKACFDENILVNNYLYYYLQNSTIQNYIIGLSQRSAGQSGVNKEALENYDFPLPPLEEQRRIVGVLDGLFGKIDKSIALLDESIASASSLMPSALNEVFEELGEKWEKSSIGNLIDVLTDYHANGSYKILKKNVELKDNEDYALMVRATDLENDFKTDLKYISENAYNFLSKTKIYGDEIIMPKIGTIGSVYLMPFLNKPSSLAMNIFLIRCNPKKALNKFLFLFLSSPMGKNYILNKANGAVTKTITKDSVRSIEIPLPPLDIQTQTVAYLDTLHVKADALKKAQEKKKEALLALKASLLESAFKGAL